MSLLVFAVLMSSLIDSYIPSDLQFSSSKLFFQHQNKLLQDIGFISPLSIDIHFKYTFQEVKEKYFIEGGEFEGLTIDHDVHEQGIIYKIGFLHPKFQNIQYVSLDLNNKVLENPSSMLPLLGGFLGWVVVFGLLAWLYSKGQFWHILFWLNLIGGGILFLFLMWKVSNALINKVRTKSVDYGGFTVNYASQTDALMLSSDVIKMLKTLSKDYWITKFCCTGNCIYLLQDVHDHEGNRVSSSSKLYSEQEKASLQQKTIDYIHNSEILSLFGLE